MCRIFLLRVHNELTDEVKSVTADASQSEMGFLLNTLLCNYTEPIRLLVRNDSQQGRGVEGEERKCGWCSLS